MSDKKTMLDGKKMWFVFAALAGVVTAGIIFTLASIVAKTETYWVLNPDMKIQAQQVITSDMLTAVSVPSSAMPANALNKQQIANTEGGDTSDDFYALYTINGGDIITSSNVGQLTEFGSSVPEGMVLASFKANPSAASGGIIGPDSKIDIGIIYAEGGAGVYSSKFFLTNVRVISATVDLDGANVTAQSSQDPAATQQVTSAPVLYTVAVTPEQAAAIAVATKYQIYIVLNPGGKVKNNSGASLDTLLSGVLSSTGSSSTSITGDGNVGTLTDPATGTDSTTPEATPTPNG